MSDSKYVTLDDLNDLGLTAADVSRCCPHATEYIALGGSSCWLQAELAEWLNQSGGES
jgi:hypothetical protein